MKSLLGFFRRLFRPAAFEVVIENGTANTIRGSVPGSFLADCDSIARDHDIRKGSIRGVRRSQGLTLDFSRDIPEESHQKFRNVFEVIRRQVKG